MNIAVLSIFVLILLVCVIAGISVLYALLLGYLLFAGYSIAKGFSVREIWQMSWDGIKTARNVLITFILIGILTALWRQGGTIPTIVAYASSLIHTSIFLVMTFMLNCLLSFLTGTAFGTAATMGSICMTMGLALGMDPVLMGGAILSGVFWGDRCSPVSTSALLVSEVTGTNLYGNIKLMIKSAAVPSILAVMIYLVLGFVLGGMGVVSGGDVPDVKSLFAEEFKLGIAAVIPAVVILLFSMARVSVRWTMLASIVAAGVVAVVYQGIPITEVLSCSLYGYHSENEAIAPMLNGGGILSMLKVTGIVCISACYSGIFQKTGILDSVIKFIGYLAQKSTSFIAITAVSVVSGAISCNQTLAIMLTEQLCSHIVPNKQRLAIYLENSVVLIAPMIPWSIASGVPLTSVGATPLSICCAFYLFLVPICQIIAENRYNEEK